MTGRIRATVSAKKEEDCLEGIRAYYKRWMPEGYGTAVIRGPQYDIVKEEFEAILRRGETCE